MVVAPPPTSSPVATRLPPKPPPESLGRFSKLQICDIITIVHPPSTTTRFSSSTLSALHLPKLPHFPFTRYTPSELPFPSVSVFPLLPHHQGFRYEIPSLPFHSRVNNPISTIIDCGAGENKHAQWAGTCDVRAPTPLIRPKKGLAEGDMHNIFSYRDLSVIVNETERVVAVELKEERSLYNSLNPFRSLPYALTLRDLEWKLALAKDVVPEQSMKCGSLQRYQCFDNIPEVLDVNPFLDWVLGNILLVELNDPGLVIDYENHLHHGSQIHSNINLIVSPMPSSLSLPDTQRCIAKRCYIWNNLSKVSRSGLFDHEGSGNTLDVGSYPIMTGSQYNTQQGGPDTIALVARHEFPRGGLTLCPPSKPPDLIFGLLVLLYLAGGLVLLCLD